jgi:hypothetical protein
MQENSFGGMIASYRDRIETLNKEATSLIEFLKKEYGLSDRRTD